MTNSLEMNTQNTLPTSFRIIGFGADTASMIDAIQKRAYDGVSAEMADKANGIFPNDENVMLILLVTGDVENATTCAKTFYQAGVLTLAFCTEHTTLPKDCLDSQMIIHNSLFLVCVYNILVPIIHSGQINLDFGDISRVLKDSQRFVTVNTAGVSLNRVANAIFNIKNVYARIIPLNKVEKMIVVLYYNKNSSHPLVINEVTALSDYILSLPEEIAVTWGLYHCDSLHDDAVCISLICSGKELQL